MRLPRRASTSPQKPLGLSNSTLPAPRRSLRSSAMSQAVPDKAGVGLYQTPIRPGHKRNWYSFSSDSSSDDQLPYWALDVIEGRRVRTSKRNSKIEQSQQDNTQLPTPDASPSSSFCKSNGINEPLNKTTIFNLPIEVHQQICGFLPKDSDVANYSQVCKKICEHVTASVWRGRFLIQFDNIGNATAEEFHQSYTERIKLSKCYILFDIGFQNMQLECLIILRDLIIQSNASISVNSHGKEVVTGLNQAFIRRILAGQGFRINLINAIGNTDRLFQNEKEMSSKSSRSLVLIVQLCLLHLVLDPTISKTRAPRFSESQQQVYKCFKEEPVFKGKNGGEINLPWLLHVTNFFKFHFKQHDGEGMLAHMYAALDKSDLPRAWCGKLQSGTQELGKRWKGTFAYLDEMDLAVIRRSGDEGCYVVDETHEGNNGFQDLTLFFDIENYPQLQFKDIMERAVHGRPAGPLRDHLTGETSVPAVKDFFGLGFNGRPYHFNGRLHSLPPQQGVPGFQRVSMISYLPDEAGNYGYGQTATWGYEGCVLPGNEIMLGRWWRIGAIPDPEEPSYSGPFIFWRVEGSAEEKLVGIATAVKFFDDIDGSMMW